MLHPRIATFVILCALGATVGCDPAAGALPPPTSAATPAPTAAAPAPPAAPPAGGAGVPPTPAPAAARPAPPAAPPSGGVEVLLCDGQTRTVVPPGTPGTSVAGALMSE